MKKNSIKVALVAVVGLIAGINVFNAQKSDVLSDIALANVEALAGGEFGCSDCGECTGTYYVCESDYDAWWEDANRNCGSLNVTLILIPGC